MRASRSLAVVILIASAFPSTSLATRLTGRWVTINPLGAETASNSGGFSLLDVTGFWGEFANYQIETDEEHAYNVKLGGFVEVFRIGQDWSLAFLSSAELVANRRGNLFFRPRATFWEEGFVLTKRFGGHRFWQLGYMHRCKHDVDNLGTYHCDGGGCERSLIYGSLQGKLLIPLGMGHEGRPASMLTLHSDLFTILQDDRNPESFSDRLPNVERAWGALGVDVHVRRSLHRDWLGAYLTAYSSLQLFGDEEGFFSRFNALDRATWHAGISGGIALQGAAHLRFGIAYEYMEDTSISPDPESSHLVSLSFTLVNSRSIW
jgi:hypothetical protein